MNLYKYNYNIAQSLFRHTITLINKMKGLIYCRVSSAKQTAFGTTVSLQAQEQLCFEFASKHGYTVSSVYKEIHSAFNKTPKVLNGIIAGEKNKSILVSSVDRFSRSSDIGLKLAIKAINNKITLVFVQEQFVCCSTGDLIALKAFLKNTEQESKTIGIRVKNARNYLIDNGMFAGGTVPYGYEVVDRKLIKNESEQNIISFIKYCMSEMIESVVLNKKMITLTPTRPYVPIHCYDTLDDRVNHITTPLTKQGISDLLNSYEVLKRGLRWKPSLITTAIKQYGHKNVVVESKSVDNSDDRQESKANHIAEISDIKLNDLNINQDSIQALRQEFRTIRLSSRLDTIAENAPQVVEHDDAHMLKLFAEFQIFKKLYK